MIKYNPPSAATAANAIIAKAEASRVGHIDFIQGGSAPQYRPAKIEIVEGSLRALGYLSGSYTFDHSDEDLQHATSGLINAAFQHAAAYAGTPNDVAERLEQLRDGYEALVSAHR